MRLLLLIFLVLSSAAWARAATVATSTGPVAVTRMADGFDQPWALAVLPDGDFLVTERGGTIIYVAEGKKRSIAGVPSVVARGQGGLLDVTLAADFATTRTLFLTYVARQGDGVATTLARARLTPDGRALRDLAVLFTASPASDSNRHFGSRVVEGHDGTLFVTLGDRGDRPSAQDRSTHNGSVLRINRDGSVPRDNPFVGISGVRPEIWSFGHRNIQGAGLDAAGTLWTAEHGARGGDEVNRNRKGANFGWPIISFGRHYSGGKIGEGATKPGMEQPQHYWDPSIAPSGLLVYSGKMWPQWRGDIFVGSLKFNYISRLQGKPLSEVEQIKGRETIRVRDIVEAGDGSIWFISVGQGAVYRMAPE